MSQGRFELRGSPSLSTTESVLDLSLFLGLVLVVVKVAGFLLGWWV